MAYGCSFRENLGNTTQESMVVHFVVQMKHKIYRISWRRLDVIQYKHTSNIPMLRYNGESSFSFAEAC